ncbi:MULTISPECIES: flagellar basal body-associated FliL family protein [Clostridium]|uniref:flagellar basal body-associated FliL family protein n=1 Tax=Clostridium TaxID=1485 RepID=UPI00069E05E5|nr:MULTISPECIES: flagellar basal body-associated FliL family protein [Clostridium]KOF55859.1 hypothetical protein AGR56_02125 [Clostridium sp. DMHC 10]MCD2345224.1 flagellar basal body-associated FliL family protein [Clostridium guangxiense]
MADDKKNDEAKKNGKGSKIIIIFLIAVIIVLLVFGILYFFVFSKKGGSTTNNTNVDTNQVQQTSSGSITTVDVDEQTYSFDDITTNLSDKDTEKFIKVSVALGYDGNVNKKLKSELEDKNAVKTPILQAEIVGVLRSKAAADFADQKKVEEIKKEILDKVNMHLKNGKISNIYFSNLVIQ